jgi:DNA-binding NtrC family response regulator
MATVLVVDDDAGIRESAALALRKAGHRVLEADSASAALRLLREHRADVVVSDIYMPGEDGLVLLQAVAERRDPPRVILITARGSVETTALAHRIGAFDYLAKPFDLEQLIDRVAAAARRTSPRPADVDERHVQGHRPCGSAAGAGADSRREREREGARRAVDSRSR